MQESYTQAEQNYGIDLLNLVVAKGYLLTPQGIAEKVMLTSRFLKRKMEEYDALKVEIEVLEEEMDKVNNLG